MRTGQDRFIDQSTLTTIQIILKLKTTNNESTR